MNLQSGSGRRLTPSEAETLWRAWHTKGDAEARNQLILSYAPMVQYLASRKARSIPAHCEVDDLVSCGLMGLVAAVDRFDPTRGATFEQFAWTRVNGAIVDELRRLDWAPRSVRRNERETEQARDRFQAKEGRPPTRGRAGRHDRRLGRRAARALQRARARRRHVALAEGERQRVLGRRDRRHDRGVGARERTPSTRCSRASAPRRCARRSRACPSASCRCSPRCTSTRSPARRSAGCSASPSRASRRSSRPRASSSSSR